jgi:ABC-type transport system substrate-binding protein
MALTAAPSPSGIRQTWTTGSISSPTTLNIGRYSNRKVDLAIDSAVSATDVALARHHYSTAYQTLLDDAAAIWMFEPLVLAGVSRRLELGTMRADAWWTSIPAWRVLSSGDAKAATR